MSKKTDKFRKALNQNKYLINLIIILLGIILSILGIVIPNETAVQILLNIGLAFSQFRHNKLANNSRHRLQRQ